MVFILSVANIKVLCIAANCHGNNAKPLHSAGNFG